MGPGFLVGVGPGGGARGLVVTEINRDGTWRVVSPERAAVILSAVPPAAIERLRSGVEPPPSYAGCPPAFSGSASLGGGPDAG